MTPWLAFQWGMSFCAGAFVVAALLAFVRWVWAEWL